MSRFGVSKPLPAQSRRAASQTAVFGNFLMHFWPIRFDDPDDVAGHGGVAAVLLTTVQLLSRRARRLTRVHRRDHVIPVLPPQPTNWTNGFVLAAAHGRWGTIEVRIWIRYLACH
jgi:hypothetical protein